MPKNAKLKAFTTPRDDLETVIAAEATARAELYRAEAAFAAKYPGDVRLWHAGVKASDAGDFLPTEIARADQRVKQASGFSEDYTSLAELRRSAHAATQDIRRFQAAMAGAPDQREARAALAVAIMDVEMALTTANSLRTAVARAEQAVHAVEEVHCSAVADVAAATEARAQTYEAAFEQGHPPMYDVSVREARQRAEATADELSTARTAAEALRSKLTAANEKLAAVRAGTQRCVREVVRFEIAPLLAEAQRIQVDLEARRQVLMVLDQFVHADVSAGNVSEVDLFIMAPTFPFEFERNRPEEHPAITTWLVAIDALAGDATAPLPIRDSVL